MITGVVIIAVGGWLWSGRGFGWLGHLPGDIYFQKGNSSFYFPLATCVLISVLLSLLSWFFRR